MLGPEEREIEIVEEEIVREESSEFASIKGRISGSNYSGNLGEGGENDNDGGMRFTSD